MRNKYKTLIISCWIVLIICFLIKIIDPSNFEIICNNDNFIKLCEWLDNSWAKYIVSTMFYVPSVYIIYLAMTNQKIGDDKFLLWVLLPVSYLKANFTAVGLVIDILIWFILPLLKFRFKNWKRVLLGNVLILAFQFISLMTRNIGGYLLPDSLLTSIIVSIDYYIMLILYYLYTRRECEKHGMV